MILPRPLLRLSLVALLAALPLLAAHAEDTPYLDRALTVHDSLRAVWASSDGLEHLILCEQLGVWAVDPDYMPPDTWNDRAAALHEIAMLQARRFDRSPRSTGNPDLEGQAETALHWTKGWRTLQRSLTTEQFNDLLDSYVMQWPVLPAVQSLSRGELALRAHEPDSALAHFDTAFRESPHPRVSGLAIYGTARALYNLKRFQAAADTLANHLGRGAFSADALTHLGWTLVRLGHVREAVGLFELAVEVHPLHERAHYMLGNGYARFNYSELQQRSPGCFPDSTQAERLTRARQHLRDGRRDQAVALLRALRSEHPDLVEPPTILAELAWLDGAYDSAERLLLDALDACPEYGRAHAVLARVQEMRRLEASERRAHARADFEAAATPSISGIETFISNWDALPPAMRKQVALAVYPWRAFLPALNTAGQTHYIKPLHERLSESPHMESLRDQRINLDSRLWDDVRGVGGFHSVTGIEDVRRMTYGGYNTLVHELTHQVHSIFTPEQKRDIEALYRQARTREANGEAVFMSRYQGSTVWEYFAEGVNAAVSPKIDEWDEREMVLERLLERDMQLYGFVRGMLSVTDVSENVAVARVNSALRLLDHGRADSAWTELARVDTAWSQASYTRSARAHVASLLDRDREAIRTAFAYTRSHPEDGDAWTSLASALEFSDSATVSAATLPDSLDTPIDVLDEGMTRARRDDLPAIRLALADHNRRASRFALALDQADAALTFNPGDPYALWQRAATLADWALSDSTAVDRPRFERAVTSFEEAIRARSGVVELRLDFARALLRAGRTEAAQAQLSECSSLRPGSADVDAHLAWLHHLNADTTTRDSLLAAALEAANPPDVAVVLAQAFGLLDARSVDSLLAEWDRIGPRLVYDATRYGYGVRGQVEPWMREWRE